MDAAEHSGSTDTRSSTGSPTISSTRIGIRCWRASSPARSPRRSRPRHRKSLNRSTPSWPTSSACSCPDSPTGTIPGSSPTFAITGSAPGVLADFLSAALNQQAMLWRTSPAATELETVTLGWLRRLIGLPDDVRRRHLRHRVDRHAARARRRARGGCPDVRAEGLAGRQRCAAPSRLLLGPGALVDRQGRDRHRPRPRIAAAGSRATIDFRMRADALRRRHRAGSRGGVLPLAVVATVGTTSTTSIDPVPAIADALRARTACGCTSTRRTAAWPRCCPRTRTCSRAPIAPTR